MKNIKQKSSLKHQISGLKSIVSSQKSAIDFLTCEKDFLAQENKLLRAALYGKKSERFKPEEEQEVLPNLFNEAETISDREEENSDEEESSDDDIKIPKDKPKKKPGRKPLPEHLPRKEVIHDLTEEQKICHCGCKMNKMGEETSEELELIPSKVIVLKHIRYKYACRKCYENVQIAPAPLKVIDKGIATASFLAHSMVSKFEDHLPFYRQSQMFKREDIPISDAVLGNQSFKGAQLLKLLMPPMKTHILSGNYMCSDEVPVRVLSSSNVTNYMWVHHSGSRTNRAVIFDYHQNRKGQCAEEFLSGFKGIHQCDGYSGYNGLYKKGGDILRAGCMDHARRKFYDVYKLSGRKAGLAKDVLKQLKLVYKVDADAVKENLSPDQIKVLRQEISKPILDKLKLSLIEKKDQIPEKSHLGKAVYYILNQWKALTLYLDYGHIRISNADAERIIKPFVIGRKNWLFNKTPSGAEASSIIYSIIETCKANNINSYKYLRYVLPKLKEIQDKVRANPDIDTDILVRDLLPYNINTDLLEVTEVV